MSKYKYIVTRVTEEYTDVTLTEAEVEGLHSDEVAELVCKLADEQRWHEGACPETNFKYVGVYDE